MSAAGSAADEPPRFTLVSLLQSTDGARLLALLDLASLGQLACVSLGSRDAVAATDNDARWTDALVALQADLTHEDLPPAGGPGRPDSEAALAAVDAARAQALSMFTAFRKAKLEEDTAAWAALVTPRKRFARLCAWALHVVAKARALSADEAVAAWTREKGDDYFADEDAATRALAESPVFGVLLRLSSLHVVEHCARIHENPHLPFDCPFGWKGGAETEELPAHHRVFAHFDDIVEEAPRRFMRTVFDPPMFSRMELLGSVEHIRLIAQPLPFAAIREDRFGDGLALRLRVLRGAAAELPAGWEEDVRSENARRVIWMARDEEEKEEEEEEEEEKKEEEGGEG